MHRIAARTPNGGQSSRSRNPVRAAGRPATLTKPAKISAPASTVNIIVVVTAVSPSASRSAAHDRRPERSAMRKAPNAPTPAASVAVKTPA